METEPAKHSRKNTRREIAIPAEITDPAERKKYYQQAYRSLLRAEAKLKPAVDQTVEEVLAESPEQSKRAIVEEVIRRLTAAQLTSAAS